MWRDGPDLLSGTRRWRVGVHRPSFAYRNPEGLVRWMTWGAVSAGILVAGYLGARVIGAWAWTRRSSELLTRLESAVEPPADTRVNLQALDALPPPVQRYLRAVLTDGQPLVTAAHLTHRGTFNQSLEQPRWSPFTSEQEVRTRRPGFVWNATIAMAPGLPVRVHDAYVNGTGVLTAAMLGVFTVADQADTPTLAEGELMRWLAESAWYPTVLLPGQGIAWAAVSDSAADATLTERGTSVTLRFTFGADGLIARVSSAGRMRTVGEREVRTPWEGRFWDYTERDGMRVPTEGEVGWRLPEGVKPYWRGTITAARYTFAR